MLIKFNHFHHLCSAYVDYEPSQIRDTIMVYLLDFNSQLGYEIIFFNKEGKKWSTTTDVKTKFPFTYINLCRKLNAVFPGNVFIQDPYKEYKEVKPDTAKNKIRRKYLW
ncbi:MAG TPA: hypothetical protein VN958_15470 [Chitinophagaceae bacterium]|nr:hypothetical protein [Chitinophagaceae bacterium]